jgi:hypothetical protein
MVVLSKGCGLTVGGTPYEGGYFRVTFNFGPEYPNVPPKCEDLRVPSFVFSSAFPLCAQVDLTTGTMTTRIFHPNVSKAGEICVDTLKKSWKKEYGVGHVLVVSLPAPVRCASSHNFWPRTQTLIVDHQMLVDLPEPRERAG